MRGKIYTLKEKLKVKKLILAGKSYKEITSLAGVPKSTISTWFGKTIQRPINRRAILEHLSNIRKLAVAALKNKWKQKRDEETQLIKASIKKELVNYPLENIGFYKSLLAILYWAEGDKYKGACGIRFTNTDPNLAKLYITLLRTCYNIYETKFRIRLYVHHYHSIKQVKTFWSKTLNVPLAQFNKVYIKKRGRTKRFRKNFAGICFIYYGDSNIRKELLELGFSLGKIITKPAPIAQWTERDPAKVKIPVRIRVGAHESLYSYRGNSKDWPSLSKKTKKIRD